MKALPRSIQFLSRCLMPCVLVAAAPVTNPLHNQLWAETSPEVIDKDPDLAAGKKAVGDKLLQTIGVARLTTLEAKPGLTRKSNGVELRMNLRAIAKKRATDIQIDWTISYYGPRSPLIIIRPSLDLPTMGQTRVLIWAVPKGKDTGFPCPLVSPSHINITGEWLQFGPYPDETAKVDLPQNPFHSLWPRAATEDWFMTVPKGQSLEGSICICGGKLKSYYRDFFPGEFAGKEAPRFFVELEHRPFDRGHPFDFDAWIGNISIPPNEVPGGVQW